MIAQVAFFSFIAGAFTYRLYYGWQFKQLKFLLNETEELIQEIRIRAARQGINVEDI